TVADDGAVLHDGPRVVRHEGLEPDTGYERDGTTFRTLPRPPGERLATVATVNDLHFGETVCGVMAGVDLGPPMRAEPGDPPYPETMNRAAAAEIAACGPDAVVAKGDLTSDGTAEELAAFLDCYGSVLGDRLHWVRGNHDARDDGVVGGRATAEVVLPGVALALLDTAVVGRAGGALDQDQLEWLDELGQRADRPVLVFGHHPLADATRDNLGLTPGDSDRLVEVVARRPALIGYFAGHTHRNRVRRLDATGDVPWVEVSATKDFPGGWAQYRVFEGGVLQVFHRISAPEALAWSERTRAMFGGLYPAYSFGAVDERCFAVWPRSTGRRVASVSI
ncbi:MAG TPA: metallophosphoesterase, partial [Acidimicrobiales bacterium]|nr:metallophosphoesterase [Acidimicrobiales bacterium]